MTDMPPAPQSQPQMVVEAPKKKRKTWLWVLLGIIVIGLGGCVATLAAIGGVANEVATNLEEEDVAVQSAASIASCEVDSVTGFGKAVVDFTNPFDEEKGYISIEVNFLDGDTVVGSGAATFENLEPGQKAKAEAIAIDLVEGTESVTCEVSDSTTL